MIVCILGILCYTVAFHQSSLSMFHCFAAGLFCIPAPGFSFMTKAGSTERSGNSTWTPAGFSGARKDAAVYRDKVSMFYRPRTYIAHYK